MIQAVAEKLKAIVAGLDGIATDLTGAKQAYLGINAAWPLTPAAEVIPTVADYQSLAAGNHTQLFTGLYYVAFYVAVTANLEADELALLPVVEAFLAVIAAEGFDRTLGGLVEDCRAHHVELDMVERERRKYRSAVVQVAVGDLDDSV